MEGIGHFPMAENYPAFREYLVPVLGELELVRLLEEVELRNHAGRALSTDRHEGVGSAAQQREGLLQLVRVVGVDAL